METKQGGIRFLSGNTLKIIAAVSMVIDHAGMIFFPRYEVFRILGRIAFPIFSFMIAEGCRYTKNRLRYFLSVFVLGVLCQSAYLIYGGNMYLNVLITFSVSILIIYTVDLFKRVLFSPSYKPIVKLFAGLLPVVAVVGAYFLNKAVRIDYGLWGCLLPVAASICHAPKDNAPQWLKRIDRNYLSVALMTVDLLALISVSPKRAWFALLAIPLLLLYSGKRGRYKLKYFFYIFYPAHLAILEGLYVLVDILKQ